MVLNLESKLLRSTQIRNECEDFLLHNVDVTIVDKIIKNLDVAKVPEIDRSLPNFFKDGVPAIAIHLDNVINLSINKLDFSFQMQDNKKSNLCLRRELRMRLKNIDLFLSYL